jgi:hypothetical protein
MTGVAKHRVDRGQMFILPAQYDQWYTNMILQDLPLKIHKNIRPSKVSSTEQGF